MLERLVRITLPRLRGLKRIEWILWTLTMKSKNHIAPIEGIETLPHHLFGVVPEFCKNHIAPIEGIETWLDRSRRTCRQNVRITLPRLRGLKLWPSALSRATKFVRITLPRLRGLKLAELVDASCDAPW